MATSSITITALTATPTLRGNKLVATVSATGPAANIPTLMLDNVEFYSSTANDFTTATKVGEGNPEFLHAGLIEEQTYYYWAKPRAVNLNYGAVYPVSPTGGVACTAIGMSGLMLGLPNGRLTASVAANALTVAVKTAAGNDPSASDSVYVAFPNATVATGNYQTRQIATALSLPISFGSTLGAASSSVPFRLWLLLFDDGGTLRLALIKCTDVNRWAIYPISGRLMSATAEGGAGAADSAGVAYAGAAITSKPFRILGYFEWSSGLATAGTWDVAPDIIRLQALGAPRPGDVIQETKVITSNTILSNTTTIPLDNTAPQSSEGSAIGTWDLSITPTSIVNFIDYSAQIAVANSAAVHMIGAVFRDAETSAYSADACKIPAANDIGRLHINNRFIPDDLNSHTYKLRVGGSAAGTWTVCGQSGAGLFGNSLPTFAAAKEIMV